MSSGGSSFENWTRLSRIKASGTNARDLAAAQCPQRRRVNRLHEEVAILNLFGDARTTYGEPSFNRGALSLA